MSGALSVSHCEQVNLRHTESTAAVLPAAARSGVERGREGGCSTTWRVVAALRRPNLMSFALETAFLEERSALSVGSREGRPDQASALSCLRLLGKAAEQSQPHSHLLLRLRESLAECVLSHEPYIGAPIDLRVPWFTLVSRVREEKRETALSLEAALLQCQLQLDELKAQREAAAAAMREKDEALALAARRLAEAEAATEQANGSRLAAREQAREAAATLSSLYRRLETSESELKAARTALARHQLSERKARDATAKATAQAGATCSRLPRGAAAPERGVLSQQLRALELTLLSEQPAEEQLHIELRRELAALDELDGGTLDPAATAGQLVASWLRSSSETAPAGRPSRAPDAWSISTMSSAPRSSRTSSSGADHRKRRSSIISIRS